MLWNMVPYYIAQIKIKKRKKNEVSESNFPPEEKYGMNVQMRKAVVSIASNISEGAARGSRKDFIRFLYFASGSASELETQLILVERFGLLPDDFDFQILYEKLRKIIRMLHGLISALKRKQG